MSKLRSVYRPHRNAKGFTIIELLIATSVFSVILLAVTMAIIQISRVYYKGVTTADTQNTARQIVDTIAQAIQFSGDQVSGTPSPVPGTNQVFCVGNKKFSYSIGQQLYDAPSDATNMRKPHVLVMDNSSADCPSSPVARDLDSTAALPTQTSRELLSPRMRLSNLVVESQGNNVYKVTVRIISGDKDLLTDPADPQHTRCKGGQSETQFCAVSELSTVVTKRIGSTP